MPRLPLSELKKKIGQSNTTVEELEVEGGKVEEFARGIHSSNPIHRDEEVAKRQGYNAIPAPLTFTRTSYFPRYRPDDVGMDFGFDLGLYEDQLVHGEQEYEFERPVVEGDVLSAETTLKDIYRQEGSKGGHMTFIVYETVYQDQEGYKVLTEQLTRIETSED